MDQTYLLGKLIGSLMGHERQISDLDYDEDRSTLISGGT
jgi:hypothetical protein